MGMARARIVTLSDAEQGAQIVAYNEQGTRVAAGDFDGDGAVELLVPDQAQESLGAIRRTNDGAMTAWSIPFEGTLSTNLAAVTLPGGVLALGAGLEEGVLRLWLP